MAGITWRGTWTSGADYVATDAVAFNGSSYVATDAVSGSTTDPANDTAHWAVLARAGDPGPQGLQGPPGDPAPTPVAPCANGQVVSWDGSSYTCVSYFSRFETQVTRDAIVTAGASQLTITNGYLEGTCPDGYRVVNVSCTQPAPGTLTLLDVHSYNAGTLQQDLGVAYDSNPGGEVKAYSHGVEVSNWTYPGRPQKGRCVYSGKLPPFSTEHLELDMLCLAANPGNIDTCSSGNCGAPLKYDLPDGGVGTY